MIYQFDLFIALILQRVYERKANGVIGKWGVLWIEQAPEERRDDVYKGRRIGVFV